jgi:putative NADH-flavin reductase
MSADQKALGFARTSAEDVGNLNNDLLAAYEAVIAASDVAPLAELEYQAYQLHTLSRLLVQMIQDKPVAARGGAGSDVAALAQMLSDRLRQHQLALAEIELLARGAITVR